MKPTACVFLLLLGAALGRFALDEEAHADQCYPAQVVAHDWHYYDAGYYGTRTWYAAGYYRWNGYSYDYRPAVHHKAPAYTVSYDPDKAKLLEIVDRLVRVAEQTTGTPAEDRQALATRAEFRDPVSILHGRCMDCHAEGVADTRGKGFAFDPAALSRNDTKLILSRTESTDPAKRMPPAGPLPAGEKRELKALALKTSKAPPARMPPAD